MGHEHDGVCEECGRNHKQDVEEFLKEVVTAVNKLLKAGSKVGGVQFALLETAKMLGNLPEDSNGQLTVLDQDGRLVAGEMPSGEHQIINAKTGDSVTLEQLLQGVPSLPRSLH